MKNKISDKELMKYVVKIVNDNSGGIKFTQLVTELVSTLFENNKNCNIVSAEYIENLIKKSKNLKILTYTFHSLNREKLFIYTP